MWKQCGKPPADDKTGEFEFGIYSGKFYHRMRSHLIPHLPLVGFGFPRVSSVRLPALTGAERGELRGGLDGMVAVGAIVVHGVLRCVSSFHNTPASPQSTPRKSGPASLPQSVT